MASACYSTVFQQAAPVIDGDRAFVEWWATFDCQPEMREEFSETLRGWFAKWLESLRSQIECSGTPADEALRIERKAFFGHFELLWL